jgi:hypothetical protein
MADATRKRKLKRLSLWAAGILAAVVFVDQAWVWYDRQITVDQRTTYITSPMDHGYPDYLAALNAQLSEGVTAGNNAGPLMPELTGTQKKSTEWAQAVYGRLGMDVPADRAGMVEDYVTWILNRRAATSPSTELQAAIEGDFGQLTYSHSEEMKVEIQKQFNELLRKPWKTREHPEVAAWLEAHQEALLKLEEMARRERLYVPLATKEGMLGGGAMRGVLMAEMEPTTGWRRGAQLLCCRGMLRLGEGDVAGFQKDMTNSLKLARLVDQMPHVIRHLLAIGVESMTWRALQGAAVSGLLKDSDAESLRQAVTNVPPVGSAARAFSLGMRYELLDNICSSKARGFGSYMESYEVPMWVIPFNFDACLRQANAYCDRYAAAFDMPDYRQRQQALDAITSDFEKVDREGAFYRLRHLTDYFLFTMLLPAMGKIDVSQTCGRQDRDLALLSLALSAYRAKQGAYPGRLADVQAQAGGIGRDLFTGDTLVYRKQESGYLLYSLGPDLKDNGGQRLENTSKPGDVSVLAEK